MSMLDLYRLGFPRGSEWNLANPVGQIWLWTSMADMLEVQDPSYFENLWSKPGYVGHDQPKLLDADVIDGRATVHSHRDGDLNATTRRIPNVAQARVVVR